MPSAVRLREDYSAEELRGAHLGEYGAPDFLRKGFDSGCHHYEPAAERAAQGVVEFPDASGGLRIVVGHVRSPEVKEQDSKRDPNGSRGDVIDVVGFR
jgi:hypothetical protein